MEPLTLGGDAGVPALGIRRGQSARDMLFVADSSQDDELPAGFEGLRAGWVANSIRALRYSWVKVVVPTAGSQMNHQARRLRDRIS